MRVSSSLHALLIAAGLAAAPALAQQDPAPVAPAEEAPATGEELSLGEAVEDDGGIGQPYIAETHGDWELRCIRTAEGDDPCQLYQLLQDADGNSVAEISLFALPAGGAAVAGATIITPLETLLTAQITIQVGTNTARRYPFTWCSAIGCVARVGFTEEEVEQFRRGADATMTIVPVAAPDQTVDLTISLRGFTAGFTAVAAANAP